MNFSASSHVITIKFLSKHLKAPSAETQRHLRVQARWYSSPPVTNRPQGPQRVIPMPLLLFSYVPCETQSVLLTSSISVVILAPAPLCLDFWRSWHLWMSNECLMLQLMLIFTPRSRNGLSIEQNESGLWLWCVWIIEGIMRSPGSRWVITLRLDASPPIAVRMLSCTTSQWWTYKSRPGVLKVVLDLLYVLLFFKKPILWQILHSEVSFQASVLGLQGAKMAPQIFMSNFLPSKRGRDGGMRYCTVAPFCPRWCRWIM